MDKQKEAELAYRASLLDRSLKHLRVELEKVVVFLTELERAKETLKTKKDSDIMFNVGAGIFGYAVLTKEEYLMPIGFGYYIKTTREEAIKKVEEQIEKTKSYYEKINAEVKKAESELINIMREAREAEEE
jgi:prefoldin alpha subunit